MKQANKVSPDRRAIPKGDLHPCKTMLCVWWELESMIHNELLDRNQTTNVELYFQQMQRLIYAIQQKWLHRWHGVLSQHDNTHIANMTKEAIQIFGWEVMHMLRILPTWRLWISICFDPSGMHCVVFSSITTWNSRHGWMIFSNRNQVISTVEVFNSLLNFGKKL